MQAINALFNIVQMWVNMCPREAWNNAAPHQLNKLRQTTLRVHQLCFHAMTLMFQDNYGVQVGVSLSRPYPYLTHLHALVSLAAADVLRQTAPSDAL